MDMRFFIEETKKQTASNETWIFKKKFHINVKVLICLQLIKERKTISVIYLTPKNTRMHTTVHNVTDKENRRFYLMNNFYKYI